MVPNVSVQELDCTAQDLHTAYARQRAALQQRLQDQAAHELYLRLERERYSRPAPLAALPATMPSPLAPALESRWRAAKAAGRE